jgi:ribonuclease P protein component
VKRKFRLTQSKDLKRVRQSGKSYAHPLVVLIVLANEKDTCQIAVSAGRSVGNAVERNRAKRLLREALRPKIGQMAPGWDMMLIARHGAAHAKLVELDQILTNLLNRAGILKEVHDIGS